MLAWYWLVSISAVFMTLATLVEKKTLRREHATAFSAAFGLLILVGSVVYLPFANFSQVTAEQVCIVFVIGLFNATTYLMIARIYKHSALSASTPLSSALPIFFVVVLAAIFLGEQLSLVQYVSIAVIIVATYLVMFDTGNRMRRHQFNKPRYRNMVVTMSVISAVSTILAKFLLNSMDVYAFIILMQLFMALDFVVFISLKYSGLGEIKRNIARYRYPLIALVLFTLVYRIAFYQAIAIAPVGLANTWRSSIFTVMAVLSGGVLFREGAIWKKTALSAIMVIATVALTGML